MRIKTLSEAIRNRIAAGEVVERPASVIKELVENALDAGAKNIEIIIEGGGRNLIIVSDDGFGMSKDELIEAVKPHTTSKLDETNLFNINSFGFRGEALASIGAISKMSITSRHHSESHAWNINIIGNEHQQPTPASHPKGTKIEVRDLFFTTPARLKFLRSEQSEILHIKEVINKLSLSYPKSSFNLTHNGKKIINLAHSLLDNEKQDRITNVMGKAFIENSISVNEEAPFAKISGYVSIPTFNRGTSSEQYLFVNNRPVKDKILLGIVKASYQDFLARDRHPVVILFLDIDNEEVDVNVHPAKLEVRFRDVNQVKRLIMTSIKNALLSASHQVSSTIGDHALQIMDNSVKSNLNAKLPQPNSYTSSGLKNLSANISMLSSHKPMISTKLKSDNQQDTIITSLPPQVKIEETKDNIKLQQNYRLGSAKCQVHSTYIISQTQNSIIIVDQHAAHERLVYEKLKLSYNDVNIKRQRLLIPEIIELDQNQYNVLLEQIEELAKFGLTIETCNENSIIVREIPMLIGNANIDKLIKDLADDLIEHGQNISLTEKIEHILETFACHHSIRSGRNLTIEEMNAILREMENTPYSGQCNHGRPTYIELKVDDIEKLFARK